MPEYVIEREIPNVGSLSEDEIRDVSIRSLDVLKSIGRVGCEASIDDARQACGDVGAKVPHEPALSPGMGVSQLIHRASGYRKRSCEQMEQHHAEAQLIDGHIDA